MIKFCIIAGARPNFMKIAPIYEVLKSVEGTCTIVVHTGQHYDKEMSGLFFEDLEIPMPDIFLGVGSASHAQQTAETMKRFENVLLEEKPDVIIVVGDVNSTLACALVASKISYDLNGTRPLIAHVEAGLRSFDRSMPEEINRLLTDHISDFLFLTEENARENLIKEGISKEKMYFVGNVMIDTLLRFKQKSEKSNILNKLGIFEERNAKLSHNSNTQEDVIKKDNRNSHYAVLTLHRPSNVDNQENLNEIIGALLEIAKEIPIIFPTHPRTLNRLKEFKYQNVLNFMVDAPEPKVVVNAINCVGPLGYLDFLHLMSRAKLVLTDSGGIQEETTIIGVPCITIRDNTERPITVTHGTNKVVGTTKQAIINESLNAIRNAAIEPRALPLWDGKAAKRIVDILLGKISPKIKAQSQ